MFNSRVGLSLSIALAFVICIGCTKSPFSPANEQENYGLKSDIPDNIGVLNALKKAAQMKNIEWKTVSDGMPYNGGLFSTNTIYTGIPYSSVLEYNLHVFLDVSLETFVTAVHNPRSVLYTENVSALNSRSILGRTYHGINCACYYGSTCSYLVVYALGLPYGISATEFPYWEEMELIDNQSPDGVKLADVLSSNDHIALVTDIKRNADGAISTITITENAFITTSSRTFTPIQFEKYLNTGYKILRYKNIEKNTTYTPMTEFVTVEGELPGHYSFNEDICPNYGNKSNYIEGDVVILNIGEDYKEKGYSFVSVYMNDTLLDRISITDINVVLDGLKYGDYKVCLTNNGSTISSAYSYFKVVNMSVWLDSSADNDVVCFSSPNAIPIYYDFCKESGNKGPSGVKGTLSHLLTPSEIAEGRAQLTSPLVPTKDYPYIKVHFETEYGRTVKSIRKDF